MAGSYIIFGEKALSFLTNLPKQHYLALVFLFHGPALSTHSLFNTLLLMLKVPLGIIRVLSTLNTFSFPQSTSRAPLKTLAKVTHFIKSMFKHMDNSCLKNLQFFKMYLHVGKMRFTPFFLCKQDFFFLSFKA